MTVAAGTRLGPYEILSPLGAGGMGEVYRARDTRLDRIVAIKVLPEPLAQDAERRARFEREAKLLASLNHPGIAHLYGFEAATLPDGQDVHLLAMELVEGEDLAARLARGKLPVDEAVDVARQVAEALEEAHERGVVHRDLKPANVKLTPEGKVKVLDFGLAKAWSGDGASGSSSIDLSQSPTLAHTGTQAGVILGTAACMSPEQARGKSVDRRSDIWAFGVLLFEMLTGRRLFEGETVSDTLAAVLRQEVPWSALPAETPAGVQRLLRRCLERDPKQRLRDVGEARIALGQASAVDGRAAERTGSPTATVPLPAWRRTLPWALTALALAAGAFALWSPWRHTPATPVPPMRLSVGLGPDVALEVNGRMGPAAVLSPDGGLLAFAGRTNGGRRQLFVRDLRELQARPVPGTEGAHSPFFSPDGQWIAFFTRDKLERVSVAGGSAIVLADAAFTARGGTWSDDGTIYFVPHGGQGVGLRRVPSPEAAAQVRTGADTIMDGETLRWPQALPGGKTILYTESSAAGYYDEGRILVRAIEHGPAKPVVRGGYHGRYVPSGHVLYVHGSTLFAVPFDLARLEATGPPVPVIPEVAASSFMAGAQFAFSTTGTLAYLPGHLSEVMSVQSLDRSGALVPLVEAPGRYRGIRFSPDGTKLVLRAVDEGRTGLYVYDSTKPQMSRLQSDPTVSGAIWSPDGRAIVFDGMANVDGAPAFRLYWQRADGTGEKQPLLESRSWLSAGSWHPSGKYLAYTAEGAKGMPDLMILPIEGDAGTGLRAGKPVPFLATRSNEGWGAFSPDGRWLAYSSNETGRLEIYVQPFPKADGKWQVSTEGGLYPAWSRDGRELFYVADDQKLMVASYSVQGGSFRTETPRPWSDVRVPDLAPWRSYDPHPDGQRIAVLQPFADPGEAKRDSLVLFLNFFDELRRLAPPK